MALEYWYMFPIGVVIAAIANMIGIGGAIFFTPLFLYLLGLSPQSALAASIIIEFFGFSSGVFGYLKRKAVNFFIIKKVFLVVLISTFLGVIVVDLVPDIFIKVLLALVILILGFGFLQEGKHAIVPDQHKVLEVPEKHPLEHKTIIDKVVHWPFALGGFFIGLLSSGLGEIDEFIFLKKLKLSLAEASGTSVFLVAIAALIATISHGIVFSFSGELLVFKELFSLVAFAVPGVIIGAQIGVHSTKYVPLMLAERIIGWLFVIMAIGMFLLLI